MGACTSSLHEFCGLFCREGLCACQSEDLVECIAGVCGTGTINKSHLVFINTVRALSLYLTGGQMWSELASASIMVAIFFFLHMM